MSILASILVDTIDSVTEIVSKLKRYFACHYSTLCSIFMLFGRGLPAAQAYSAAKSFDIFIDHSCPILNVSTITPVWLKIFHLFPWFWPKKSRSGLSRYMCMLNCKYIILLDFLAKKLQIPTPTYPQPAYELVTEQHKHSEILMVSGYFTL